MNLSNLRQSITQMDLSTAVSLIGEIRARRRMPRKISSPKVLKAKKENDAFRKLISGLNENDLLSLLQQLEES